jgi:site-specific DNA recombinase
MGSSRTPQTAIAKGNGRLTDIPSRLHAAQTVRCAIYTRKSTEEGLEQELNSLDAQREVAEAYLASQQHQGWIGLPQRYDDGGSSGGNLDRPALKRLLADIATGKIDVVLLWAHLEEPLVLAGAWVLQEWKKYLGVLP